MKPIISENIRIRNHKYFEIGDFSVIDDFCYFSAKIKIGKHCHIAAGCTLAGGKTFQITVGDYTSISSGVKIWCRSNDYINDLVILNVEHKDIGDKQIEGNVSVGNMCGVGANAVIMPNNTIPDGTIIGALSYVPPDYHFEEWSVYAGIPIKFIKKRNKENVLRQLAALQKDEETLP